MILHKIFMLFECMVLAARTCLGPTDKLEFSAATSDSHVVFEVAGFE